MRWFAHSLEGKPEAQWESQIEHSDAVGSAARRRAEKFGFGEVAAVAGALHDLGKYTRQFQDYIRGKAESLDHSSAGAVHARKTFQGSLGLLIAHCIAGHHTGLKDGLLAKEQRLDRHVSKLPPIVAAATADGFPFPKEPSFGDMTIDDQDQGFQLACLTRMLFSCLVDADRTETARFRDGSVDEEPTITMADLAAELRRYSLEQDEERLRCGSACNFNPLRRGIGVQS